MSDSFLPFALPSIGEEEIAEVVDTMRSGWLTTGAKTKRFEELFRTYLGVRHALAVNSGTAGLHLALEALGVGRGHKVITTPYTFTATAEVIRYLDAEPIFVDIEPLTLNIDPLQIAAAFEKHPNIKVILPVHFAGRVCAMDEILALAAANGATVVEDAAHALTAAQNGKPVGAIGPLTVFSFYVTKTITTGEGGMLVTNDDAITERVRTMRLHGISRDVFDRYSTRQPSWYYEVVAPGFKYNLTDIAAAIGIHQLAKADSLRTRRAEIARRYNEAFADLPLSTPPDADEGDTHAWHLYVIRLKLESLPDGRDRFIEKLAAKGIGSSVHFIPLHLHPYWRDRYQLRPEDFPVSLDTYQRAISLPIYPKMTDADVDRVIDAVRAIAR